MNEKKDLFKKNFNLAITSHRNRNYQDAINYYNKTIDINPKHTNSYYNLGLLLHEIKNYKEAIGCFEKTLETEPGFKNANNNLGIIYYKLGENLKAITCYENEIQINPLNIEAYNNLGIVFYNLGEVQKARNFYEKAIQIEPDFKRAHNNLGILFYDIKETEKAINCFEKVLTIDPKNKEVNYNLGRIYQGIGNQMRAVENYQKTLINRSEINFEIDQEKDQKLDPATVFFFLELTNKCNFHCEFCPSDSQTRLHGYMELSLVKKIFDEISQKKIVPQVALHLMGEPTLHPKLNEILVYARSKNVKIALTTNGSTLVKKKVPKLLESISGKIVASLMTPTKKTYKIRGDVRLSWDRYIDNFRLLIQEHLKKISRDDKIEYQIIIRIMVTGKAMEGATKVLESSTDIQESYNEWSNFVETTEKELGLKPFTRQKIDSAKTFSILSEYEEMSYNLQKGIKIQFWRAFTFANSRVRDEYKLLPQEKTQYCPHPFTDFGVLWNGDVSLCCLDYDGTLKVGNVKNHSVEDVLKSIDSKKLRASMYGLEKLHPTCQKCQSRPVEK
jgi:tetratricopeptide (TPR) repeat protein